MNKIIAYFSQGFTLVELLIALAIIGFLSGIVLIQFSSTQHETRDSERLQDIAQILVGLRLYHTNTGTFPDRNNDSCCDGWDQGPCKGDTAFISALVSDNIISSVPVDRTKIDETSNGCYGYGYYLYDAGYRGCDAERGKFFVLGIRDLEGTAGPHPESPGWACGSRDWQEEFEWVTGDFER